MYTAKITSPYKSITTLTGREQDYQIVSIGGLSEPAAQINLSQMVGVEGAAFNSAKIQTRNIVLTIRINGDVEANRLELYKSFPVKERVRFDYENSTLAVYAEGYVESVECDLFSNSETAQISIICPDPFMAAAAETTVSLASGGSTVTNAGTAETGFTCTIEWEQVTPTWIQIQNSTSGEIIRLEYANFSDYGTIVISTVKGAKSIMYTDERTSETISLLSALTDSSTLFSLPVGTCTLIGTDSETGCDFTVKYRNRYRGV